MRQIAIIGAGGFGREVKMLIDQINAVKVEWEFLGYFDDGKSKGSLINGYPVLGSVDDLNSWEHEIDVVAAIGDPTVKKEILNRVINNKVSFGALIHPNVIIGTDDVAIGEGVIICAGGIITVNVNVGNHVIFNLGCTVGHDSNIGNYSSFMPSVNISGEVNVGECVYVGTGAKIINQVEIGSKTIVGAGSVVTKSLPPSCTAVGIPARAVKYH